MPIIGTDLTPAQRQFFRQAADLVQPGLTDQQVLDWITEQGIEGAAEKAREIVLARVRAEANALLAAAQVLYEDAFPDDD